MHPPHTLIPLTNLMPPQTFPPVISVVAKSGTGKTTLIEKLIPELTRYGLRVGVLKHHSHPTYFDLPGKDTYRLAEAGAEIVVGASAVQTAVFIQQQVSNDLNTIIERFLVDMDIVLTEGYKCGDFPKIEVHRAERSQSLLCEPDELLLIATDESLDIPVPQFDLNDVVGISAWLIAWLQHNAHPPQKASQTSSPPLCMAR